MNGYYRLTRGVHAQFGLRPPDPDGAARTALAEGADARHFEGPGYNACNVLDVVHPLWLSAHYSDKTRSHGEAWTRRHLAKILDRWHDGEGFAFAPDHPGEAGTPSLQGTEMWLATIWLMADYLGMSEAVGYRPRGIHRPEPAIDRAAQSSPRGFKGASRA
ncbi:hypothetical protein [Frondihabitans sp. PAMC 28766]|uniref:hypothetical protein n=1 Tax=Frondihabitans sp. PAMC 28766 TaxID=1795630 RepID=UPI000AEA1DC5